MPQENIFPPDKNDGSMIKGKVLILYFIDKLDFPASNSQITMFVQSLEFMNYYSLQQYLNELISAEMVEKTFADNKLLYFITEDGRKALGAFWDVVPGTYKKAAEQYLADNFRKIKQEHEVAANYYFDHVKNEYVVKCAVHEDDLMLMELNVSVVTRDLAAFVCTNWNANVGKIYHKIIKLVTSDASKDD